MRHLLCWLLLCFALGVSCRAELEVYPGLPGGMYSSDKYTVRVRPVTAAGDAAVDFVDTPVFQYARAYRPAPRVSLAHLADNHWTTVSLGVDSCSAQAEFELACVGTEITRWEILPSTAATQVGLVGGRLRFRMSPNTRLALLVNGERQAPLFVFCDPSDPYKPDLRSADVAVIEPGTTSAEHPLQLSAVGHSRVIAFPPGIHFVGKGFALTSDNGTRMAGNQVRHIHIAGGALVIGSIRAPFVKGLRVSGRGILCGEEAYGYADTGGYTKDRIFNSAVAMASYGDESPSGQEVEGITSIMPLKYHIQVGAHALVKNVKCFSFRHTTDGVGAGAFSTIRDCFFKVNDDVVKLYCDGIVAMDLSVWHQDNGAVFQLGWHGSQATGCRVSGVTLYSDDSYHAKSGQKHWSNHAVINWHSSKSVKGSTPVHRGHLFEDFNTRGMPPVKVWRFLAINMDGSCGDAGTVGGIVQDLMVERIMLGDEQLGSYVGATIGRSEATLSFKDCWLGQRPLDATSVKTVGAVTITP